MLKTFLVALSVVFTMLLYAVPGFALVKTKLIKENGISAFAKLLMCVCSPCLVYSSITRNSFSKDLAFKLVFAFLFITAVFLLVLLIFHFVFKKKREDERYRIFNLATTFANCGFMGVPVLEALFPGYSEAIAFSAMASLSMNILAWSVGAYLISQDKKYISPKKIFFNPATIALLISLPIFVFGIQTPKVFGDAIGLLAKMTTPLCMLIMGMRLACVPPKDVFLRPMQYLIVLIKQIAFPLMVLLILLPLPLDSQMKASIYILTACPVATVILNMSEMIGKGQKSAASLVLLGTTLSIITIPLMSLLIAVF